jgi:methionyl-tRNA synthetase
VSFTAKNVGSIPEAGELRDIDRTMLAATSGAFATVGGHLDRSRFKLAVNEAMRVIGEANKYLSDEAPWKLRETDPDRMRTICHVALQVIDDAKTLLAPFLPNSSQKVHEMLGGTGVFAPMPEVREVDEEGGSSYPVLMGEYDTGARWESTPVRVGAELAPPVPLFKKLDVSVVDEELERMRGDLPQEPEA